MEGDFFEEGKDIYIGGGKVGLSGSGVFNNYHRDFKELKWLRVVEGKEPCHRGGGRETGPGSF